MDLNPDILAAFSLAMGAAWASGLNLYATTLIIGAVGALGLADLPSDLDVLSTPPVLIAAGVLYAIEFFADKVPGVDTLNDTVHTFIRIPAGALLAYGSVAGIAEPWQAVAVLLLGGVVSAGSHATKTGARAMINTSPEPFSNWAASIFEDVLVVIGLSLAIFKPAIFLIWLAAFALFVIWLLPKVWRGLRGLWRKFKGDDGPEQVQSRDIIERFSAPPTDSRSSAPPAPRDG